MKETCTIVAVEEEHITVAPGSLEACMSCTSDCGHKGTSFEVTNPHHFQIKPGMSVTVETKPKTQALQGILALFVPFACAVILWFCAPFLAGLLGMPVSEGFRAGCVLVGLFVPALIVFLVTRFSPPSLPWIENI